MAYHHDIQTDFVENYTCVFQDGSIVYTLEPDTTVNLFCMFMERCHSNDFICSCFDNIIHDKNTTVAYFYEILLHVNLINIEQLEIWSDGSFSQFKNRFVAYSMSFICVQLSMLMELLYNLTWKVSG